MTCDMERQKTENNELSAMDWDKVLRIIVDFASCAEAKEILGATTPLAGSGEAQKSFEIIEESEELLKTGHRPTVESLDLFYSWSIRLKKKALLKSIELKDIRSFLNEVDFLKKTLQNFKTSKGSWLKEIKSKLMSVKEPLSAIDQLINSRGEILRSASEKLFNLSQEERQLVFKTQKILDELVKGHDYDPLLQDKYVTNREGRWVVPIKSGMRHDIDGIIQDMSSSKQTVFMEPEAIVPLNNRIREIQIDIEKEIEKLLRKISDYLSEFLEDFYQTKEAMVLTDCFLAKARLSSLIGGQAVRFSPDSVRLIDLKHPLLIIQGESVVPNSLYLDQKERILILSGPNSGGKTVLLKSFGLACQMARCGLTIPARSGSSLPFFKKIFAVLGDNQSVDKNLSSFSGHLQVLNRACGVQGSESLILIDEICGSTDPEEGSALARSFIEHYASQKIFACVTSHLGLLKAGWDRSSGVVNGSMNYDTHSGRVTYQLTKGLAGQSFALAMAKKTGILKKIYEKAKVHLSPQGQKRFEMTEEMEKMKEEVIELKARLNQEILQVKEDQSLYQKKIQEFESEKKDRMRDELSQWTEKLKKQLREKKIQNLFEGHTHKEELNQYFPELAEDKSESKSEDKVKKLEDFVKKFPPGSPVFIQDINRDGIIQGGANPKGEVPVLSGFMRVFIHWKLLKPPRRGFPSTKKNQSPGFRGKLGEKPVLEKSPLEGKKDPVSRKFFGLGGRTA